LVDGHNPAKTGKRSRLIGADTVYSTRACCLHTTFHYYTKKQTQTVVFLFTVIRANSVMNGDPSHSKKQRARG